MPLVWIFIVLFFIFVTQGKIMASIDDLEAKAAETKAALDALKDSNDKMIARLEALLAALPPPGSDPRIDAVTAELQSVVDEAKAVQATDDAERP